MATSTKGVKCHKEGASKGKRGAAEVDGGGRWDAVKRQLDAITAHLDEKRTKLDSEQSARRDLEAELVLTREAALVACNKKKKLSRGRCLVTLFFFFFSSSGGGAADGFLMVVVVHLLVEQDATTHRWR